MCLYADLHIHSALSPCGDEEMTPNNIVGMAFIKGLKILAVTDHNTCAQLPAVQSVAETMGITLLPGMEAQTREEVHVLCYFPTVDWALAFEEAVKPALPAIPNTPEVFGRQLIFNEQDEVIGERQELLLQSFDLSIDELVGIAQAHRGVCVPAHINRGANSLLMSLGFIPEAVPFAGLEIDRRAPEATCDISGYTVLHSSDAHRLEDISEPDFILDISENSPEAIMAYFYAHQNKACGE